MRKTIRNYRRTAQRVTVARMASHVERIEADLLVFISSRMDEEMAAAREIAKQTIDGMDVGRPWVFECTPASSETATDAYLRNVEEADFVVWLVGSTTTPPVEQEVNRCLATNGRLLVFKLPAEQRDARTEALLQSVSEVIKWREVESVATLGAEIRPALWDEIIRGFRDPKGPARNRTFQENRNWSFARCEVSWRLAGASDALAKELAHDAGVGDALGDLPPGLNVVVGPQGSGKTLAAHRLFQNAIKVAIEDPSKPFPVFLESVDLRGNFREVIASHCNGHVDPLVQPITVFVDGLDERGANEANSLLRQMVTYVVANPKTTVIASVRPLPGLQLNANMIEMPSLDHQKMEVLIQRVSGKGLAEILPLLGQISLYRSAKSPLIAVMLGAWLRDDQGTGSVSTYKLVEHLAVTALGDNSNDSVTTDTLLQRLAARAITYGTRVGPSEVTAKLAEQRLLADSRLVLETENGYDFALPIFREWYAARAILEGAETVEKMDITSERWAIPLSIVAHSDDQAKARVVMERVASTNPAVAAAVLKEDEDAWYFGGSTPSVPSTAKGVGEELRRAMGMWSDGLGLLFRAIGPTDPEGELATLGVVFTGEYLHTGWYGGSEPLDPVVDFTGQYNPSERGAGGLMSKDWPAWNGRAIPPTQLWPWLITKEYLVENLKEALEERSLSYVVPESLPELAWDFGVEVIGDPWHRETPPSVLAALEHIRQLGDGRPTPVRTRGKDYSRDEIEVLGEHLAGLLRDGHQSLQDPWLTADLPRSSSPWKWSLYSDECLLHRTAAVYSAALKIYQGMVEHWFLPFSGRLRMYRLMPVRLEGLLTKWEIGGEARTGLSWRPVILPSDQNSHVDFGLGGPGERLPGVERHFEEQREAFIRLRSGDPDTVVLFYSGLGGLDFASNRPATDLAHEWLTRELEDLGWVD